MSVFNWIIMLIFAIPLALLIILPTLDYITDKKKRNPGVIWIWLFILLIVVMVKACWSTKLFV